MRTYVFNGDADGICALQQLRLAEPRAGMAASGAPGAASASGATGEDVLITGVKRDIALLARVQASVADPCTVLDVSLDVNRTALVALLEAGVSVRYFDHHFAGEVPRHPRLDAHLDPSPDVCTSLLVDRYLDGRCRRWAVVGTFGDSLVDEGRALAEAAGLGPAAAERLNELGVAMNYNAYGETIADLHVPPAELAEEILAYADPLDFAERSATSRLLVEGFGEDMDRARGLAPSRRVAGGALLYMLPDAAWARRASGTLANDLAKAHAGSAVAIVSPKTGGGYLVSLRVPRDSSISAEGFCRQFPSGGGRRTAAGINHLPSEELETFAAAFERQFKTS